MRPHRLIVGAIALLSPLALGADVKADPVTVLGTASIFSAGNDAANHNAWINSSNKGLGTPAPYIDLGGAGSGRFLVINSITGAVDFGGGKGFNGPDGFAAPSMSPWPALGGISGFVADRAAALLGVFTTDAGPSGGAPDSLNFVGNSNFAALSPLLNQLFLIGDGLTGTGSGQRQIFLIPDSATRLYLGLADRSTGKTTPGAYQDNKGSFTVNVGIVPEPSSVVVALAGIGAALVLTRRRRTGSASDAA